MAGNLLSALASALGAGIQGYGRQSMLNDENRRRDEEMEVLRQDRAAMRQQQMLEQLRRNAESGIFQGEAPRGKEQLIGALQSSFLPQGLTIDNEQRFRQVAPGWHQDFAQSEMGREIAGRQAQARVKSDADFAKRQEGNEARALKSQELRRKVDLFARARKGDQEALDELNALGEDTSPKAPVRGTPEYLKMLEDEERVKAKFDRSGGTGGGALPSAAVKELTDFQKRVGILDEAIGAVKAAPDGFGFKYMVRELMPGAIERPWAYAQNKSDYASGDPRRGNAQQLVANIGSLEIRDRSGAAVTVAEFPRLRPFIPSIGDPPEKVVANLQKMRDIIAEEERLYQQNIGRGRLAGSQEDQVRDAMPRSNPYR